MDEELIEKVADYLEVCQFDFYDDAKDIIKIVLDHQSEKEGK